MAKTDWGMGDTVEPTDMNDIGQEINELRNEVENIPPASLTEAGLVKLNNSINDTSDEEAATPSAVKKAYDLASAAETPAGAQAKANAAETNAKNASVSKTWAGLPSGDLNTLTTPGRYQGIWSNTQPNEPITTSGARRAELDVRANTMSSPTNIVQYLSYIGGVGAGNIYWRIYDNNVWSAWRQLTDSQGFEGLKSSVANGKNDIAAAIRDKNGIASGSDTFAQLAAAIRNISTGSRGLLTSVWNSGRITNQSTGLIYDLFVIPPSSNSVDVFTVLNNNEYRMMSQTLTDNFSTVKIAALSIIDTNGIRYDMTLSRSSGDAAYVTLSGLYIDRKTELALCIDRTGLQEYLMQLHYQPFRQILT